MKKIIYALVLCGVVALCVSTFTERENKVNPTNVPVSEIKVNTPDK